MPLPQSGNVAERSARGVDVRRPEVGDVNPGESDLRLESFREHLLSLARSQIQSHLQARIDLSGVVQQTLFEAHQAAVPLRAEDSQVLTGWLRKLLARNLIDALRWHFALKRDVRRERAMATVREASSLRPLDTLAADHSSPSRRLIRAESFDDVCRALRDLPDDQRQVLELHYLEGLSLQQLAQRLDRSPGAVAGLLFRGMRTLRGHFAAGV